MKPKYPFIFLLTQKAFKQIKTCETMEYLWPVIIPFLVGLKSRAYATICIFCLGVIPPIPILGRSLLYSQSHAVA